MRIASGKLALLLPLLCVSMLAQVTPNIALNIPNFNSSNWNVPLNNNFIKLDSLLSGGSSIPNLTISGQLKLSAISGLTQCLHVNSSGVVSGSGVDCPASAITGITTGGSSGLQGGGTTGTLNLSLLTTCSANQVLQWSGSAWACATVGGSGTVTHTVGALTQGEPMEGNGAADSVVSPIYQDALFEAGAPDVGLQIANACQAAASIGIGRVDATGFTGPQLANTNFYHICNANIELDISPYLHLYTSVPQFTPYVGFKIRSAVAANSVGANGFLLSACGPQTPAEANYDANLFGAGQPGCTINGTQIHGFPNGTNQLIFNYHHAQFTCAVYPCNYSFVLGIGGQGTTETEGWNHGGAAYDITSVTSSCAGLPNCFPFYTMNSQENTILEHSRWAGQVTTGTAANSFFGGVVMDNAEAPASGGWARMAIRNINQAGSSGANNNNAFGIVAIGDSITIQTTQGNCAQPWRAWVTGVVGTGGGQISSTQVDARNNGGSACASGVGAPTCSIYGRPSSYSAIATFPTGYNTSATCTPVISNGVVASITVGGSNTGFPQSFLTGCPRIQDIDLAGPSSSVLIGEGIVESGCINPNTEHIHNINAGGYGVHTGAFGLVVGGRVGDVDMSSGAGALDLGYGSQSIEVGPLYAFSGNLVKDEVNNTTITAAANNQALASYWHAGLTVASNGTVLSSSGATPNLVGNNIANAFTGSGTLNLSALTNPSSFILPNIGGATATSAGGMAFDTTGKNLHVGANSVDNIVGIVPASTSIVAGDCVLWAVTTGHITLNDAGACPSGFVNPMTTLGDIIYGGASGAATRLAGPTTPNSVPQLLTSTPSSGVATAPQWNLAGVNIDAQTTSPYTIPATDRTSLLTLSSASAFAVTLPQANSAGFTNNFTMALGNQNTGLVTITPTTSQINQNATAIVPNQWFSFIYSNNTNYIAPIMPTIGAFPSCVDSGGNHLNFTTATGAISCGTSTSVSSLDQVTGSAAQATGTETAAGHEYTFAGVETANLTYPFTIQNTSNSNNTSGALIVTTKGSGTAQVPLVINEPTADVGDFLDAYVNATVTNGVLSGGTKTIAMQSSGTIALGSSAPTVAGSPTGGGFGCVEGTGPTAAATDDFVWCDSTLHDVALNANGGVKKLVASSIGYNSGSISASVGSTNIASSANFPTGQYILSCDVVVTAVGSSPTLAVTIGWTDISGTARTKTCTTGVVGVSDNPVTQTITSNGSAAITVTQTLAVSTATWQTTAAITRLQ